MQTPFKLVLTACALIALSVPTQAQTRLRPQGPGRVAGAPRETQRERDYQAVVFLPPDVLNAITPLQPDQITRLTAIRNEMHQDVKAAGADRAKIADIRTHAVAAIRTVLTADQNSQIEHVMSAVVMLQRTHTVPPPTLKDVKLTSAQWEQIVTIEADEYAKLRGENKDQRNATFAEFKSRVDPVLTDAQRQVVAGFIAAHPGRPVTAPAH